MSTRPPDRKAAKPLALRDAMLDRQIAALRAARDARIADLLPALRNASGTGDAQALMAAAGFGPALVAPWLTYGSNQ